MNIENYLHRNNPTTKKSLRSKELKNFLDLNINEAGLPFGKANQLLVKEKFNYEDCINLVLLEYLSDFKDSLPDLFTEGEH